MLHVPYRSKHVDLIHVFQMLNVGDASGGILSCRRVYSLCSLLIRGYMYLTLHGSSSPSGSPSLSPRPALDGDSCCCNFTLRYQLLSIVCRHPLAVVSSRQALSLLFFSYLSRKIVSKYLRAGMYAVYSLLGLTRTMSEFKWWVVLTCKCKKIRGVVYFEFLVKDGT